MATQILTNSGLVEIDSAEVIRTNHKAKVTRYKVEDATDMTPHVSNSNDIIEIRGILSDATFRPEDTNVSSVVDNRTGIIPTFLEPVLDIPPFEVIATGSFTQFLPEADPKFTVTPPSNNNIGRSRQSREYLERALKSKKKVTLIEGVNSKLGSLFLFSDDRTTDNLMITSFSAERTSAIKSGYKISITLEQIRVVNRGVATIARTAVVADDKKGTAGGETTSGAEQTNKDNQSLTNFKQLINSALLKAKG